MLIFIFKIIAEMIVAMSLYQLLYLLLMFSYIFSIIIIKIVVVGITYLKYSFIDNKLQTEYSKALLII